MPLLTLTILLMAGFPLTPFGSLDARAESTVLAESWESITFPGWTSTGIATGVSQECGTAVHGACYLKLNPAATGQMGSIERDLSITLNNAPYYTFSFYYRNDHVYSTTDSWFRINLAPYGYVKLDPTWGGINDRVVLGTHNDTSPSIYTYTSDTWYKVVIELDLNAHTAEAHVLDTAGMLLGRSTVLSIPGNVTGIGKISFNATYSGRDPYNEPPFGMHYDYLQVITASVPGSFVLWGKPGPGRGEVNLTWPPPADNGGAPITGYNVYRNVSGNYNAYELIAQLGNVTSFIDSGKPDNVSANYIVKAVNQVGEGLGASASVRTFTTPSQPWGLAASPGASVGTIKLTWWLPNESGGSPDVTYRLYRGPASGSEELVGTFTGPAVYNDTHRTHNTTYYYRLSASNVVGESPKSGGVSSMPRPDHAAAPPSILVSPMVGWSGDNRTVNFTYSVTTSECEPAASCPVLNEWRVYQDGSLEGADGTLLANGSNTHAGHAGTETYTVSTQIQPQGEPGVFRIKVAVRPRADEAGGWNVSWVELRIDSQVPGVLTGPTTPLLNRSVVPTGGSVAVNASYTVFQNQCRAALTCPVLNEWRLLLRGGQINPHGALLANGSNVHPAHGSNETYAISQVVYLPEIGAGDYELVVAARHNRTSPWQFSTAPLQVDACGGPHLSIRLLDRAEALPEGLRPLEQTYRFNLSPYRSLPVRLYDTCSDLSDQNANVGIGGARLRLDLGDPIVVLGANNAPVPFLVGSDLDGTGVVGDTSLDCLRGPHWDTAVVECPPDAAGHILVFLLDDPRNPVGWPGSPPDEPLPTPHASSIRVCKSLLWLSFHDCDNLNPFGINPSVPYVHPPYAEDNDDSGYGDAWEANLGAEVDQVINQFDVDLDGDGLSNINEFRWDTLPLGPLGGLFPNARDYDGDHWEDGPEQRYWNNQTNDATTSLRMLSMVPRDSDMREHHWRNDASDGDDLTTVHDDDVDGDGLKDGEEWNVPEKSPLGTYPEFADSDCSLSAATCPLPTNVWDIHPEQPGTGDGISDLEERNAWNTLSGRFGGDYRTKDWDLDATANNLLDPDSDGDEVLDGTEFHCRTPVSTSDVTACTHAYFYDSDEDGLLDGNDVIVRDSTDPRWNLFAHGITYVVQQDGSRRYLGEFSQGTHPLNADTNGNGIKDGDEAIGIHGTVRGFEEMYEDYSPLNQDLTTIQPWADQWLSDGTEQVSATSTAGGILSLGTGIANDPIGFIQDALTLAPNPLDLSSPDELVPAVLAATECVDPTNPPPLQDPLEELVPRVDCLVGAFEDFALQTVQDVQSVDIQSIPEKVLGEADRLDDLVVEARHHFIDPVLSTLPSGTINYDGNNLGAMLTPPNPWDGDAYEGTPLERTPWVSTPFPRFTATMLEGPLFNRIAQLDQEDPAGLEIIGTVDAGFYNVYVELPDRSYFVKVNRLINEVTPIDLQDPNNDRIEDAELLVRAEYTSGVGATPVPRLTIQRTTPFATGLLVAVFMQIPSTDYILAMGNDARGEALGTPEQPNDAGQPGLLRFSLGVNAIEAALSKQPKYEFRVETPDVSWPTHLVASLFRVVETDPYKRLKDGERADLAIHFNATPNLATAILTDNSQLGGGFHLEWSGTTSSISNPGVTPDVRVAARAEHAGALTQVGVSVKNLPAAISTHFQKTPTTLGITHTTSTVIPSLVAEWASADEIKTTGGGVELGDIPSSLRFNLSQGTSATLTYSSNTPLGPTRFTAFERLTNSTQPEPCTTASTPFYFTHVKNKDGSCDKAYLDGLLNVTATLSGNDLIFRIQRNNDGGAFLFLVDDKHGGEESVYLRVSNWPSSINITATKTPSGLTMTAMLSKSVDTVDLVSHDQGKELLVKVVGIPTSTTIVLDQPSGSVTVDFSTRLTDFSIQYRGNQETVSLGDNDGVILVSRGGVFSSGAVRVRELKSVELLANPASGISLRTDTLSNAPFNIRWDSDGSWISATLPKLPSNVEITYLKTPDATTFHYGADISIPDVEGLLKFHDGGATVYAKLKNFPQSLDITSDSKLGTTTVLASQPIQYLEFALVGADRKLNEPSWTNFVSLDRLATLATSVGELPQFHLRLQEFKSLSVRMSDNSVHANVTFGSPASAGTLGVRYRGAEGWLETNVTTPLPPSFHFEADRNGVNWSATPGFTLDIEGAADFEGFQGRWRVDDLPDTVRIAWTSTINVFEAKVNHSAINFPLLDFEGTLDLGEEAPAALVKLHIKDLPPHLVLRANGTSGRFGIVLSDAAGSAATATTLEVAYVASSALGLPLIAQEAGTVAYARLRKAAPSEFYARLSGFSATEVSTLPEPANSLHPNRVGRMWAYYEGTANTPILVDVADDLGTSLRARVSAMPSRLEATLLADNSSGLMMLDVTASNTTTWDLDITTKDRMLRVGGNLPRALHADNAAGGFLLRAEPSLSLHASYGPPNAHLVPVTNGDYFVARLIGNQASFAGKITGLQTVSINPVMGSYSVQSASSHDVFVDVLLQEGSLRGTIANMPATFDVTMGTDGSLVWTADAATTSVDMQGYMGASFWRMSATAIPPSFEIRARAGGANAILRSLTPGSAFGTLELAYTAHAATRVPELIGSGFVFDMRPDEGSNGNQYPNSRLVARINNLESLWLEKAPHGIRFGLDTSTSQAITGKFLAADRAADLVVAQLPTHLQATLEWASPNGGGVYAKLDADQPLGQLAINYTMGNTGLFLEAAGLPSMMELRYLNEGGGPHLEYSSTGGGATLAGVALISEGLAARFNLTQVPQRFTLDVNHATMNVDFVVQEGALSGTLFAGPIHARTYRPPAGAFGASLSRDPENEHIWARVESLKEIRWFHQPTEDIVEVKHASPTPGKFYLHYEDTAVVGNLTLNSLPSGVKATVSRGGAITSLTYRATDIILGTRVQLAEKDGTARNADVRLSSVPSEFDATLATLSNGVSVQFVHSAEAAPNVRIDIRGADGNYAHGTIERIPAMLALHLDKDAKQTTNACPFRLELSEPIPLIYLHMGKGAPTEGRWLSAASHFLSLDLRDPEAPGAWMFLKELQAAKFCWSSPAGFEAQVKTGATMSDLRIYYQDVQAYLKLRIVGLTGGTYTIKQAPAGTFSYDGAGAISRLEASGTIGWSIPIFNRKVVTFNIVLENIPAHFSFGADTTRLRLDSDSDGIGACSITMGLGAGASPPGGGGGGGTSPVGSSFALDALDFAVGHLYVAISDKGLVEWEGTPQEKHKIVFRNAKDFQLGIDLWDLRPGEFKLTTPGPGQSPTLDVTDFTLRPNVGLRAAIEIPDWFITVRVRNMPQSWDAHASTFTEGFSLREAMQVRVTPSTHLDEVTFRMGHTKTQGFEVAITAIPGGVPISILGIAGAAVLWDVSSGGASFGGCRFTYFLDPSHHVSASVGQTKDFMFEADLDGSTDPDHEGNPRFIDFRFDDTALITVTVQWGDVGTKYQGSQLVVPALAAGVLVAGKWVTEQAVTGLKFIKNGAVGASQHALRFIQRGVEYVADSSVWRDP